MGKRLREILGAVLIGAGVYSGISTIKLVSNGAYVGSLISLGITVAFLNYGYRLLRKR